MEIPYDALLSFLFVLSRSSGIFIFTPFLGSMNVPVQVRILLSAAVSYLLAVGAQVKLPQANLTPVDMLIGLCGELLVGMAIGFVAHALFGGLQCAAQLIGFQLGLSLVNTVDPQTSDRSTTLAVYQSQLGLMLFLGLNAHHWFIRAIASSLTVLPPFSMSVGAGLIAKMGDLVAQILVIGFQIAAPVIAVLLLTDLALGFIGRSAPQLHILMVGMPLKVLIGLSALGIGLYVFPTVMRAYSVRFEHDAETVIRLLAG